MKIEPGYILQLEYLQAQAFMLLSFKHFYSISMESCERIRLHLLSKTIQDKECRMTNPSVFVAENMNENMANFALSSVEDIDSQLIVCKHRYEHREFSTFFSEYMMIALQEILEVSATLYGKHLLCQWSERWKDVMVDSKFADENDSLGLLLDLGFNIPFLFTCEVSEQHSLGIDCYLCILMID